MPESLDVILERQLRQCQGYRAVLWDLLPQGPHGPGAKQSFRQTPQKRPRLRSESPGWKPTCWRPLLPSHHWPIGDACAPATSGNVSAKRSNAAPKSARSSPTKPHLCHSSVPCSPKSTKNGKRDISPQPGSRATAHASQPLAEDVLVNPRAPWPGRVKPATKEAQPAGAPTGRPSFARRPRRCLVLRSCWVRGAPLPQSRMEANTGATGAREGLVKLGRMGGLQETTGRQHQVVACNCLASPRVAVSPLCPGEGETGRNGEPCRPLYTYGGAFRSATVSWGNKVLMRIRKGNARQSGRVQFTPN